MKFEIASIDSLILYLSNEISEEVSQKIRALYLALKENMPYGVVELTPSYTTLLIRFNPLFFSHEKLQNLLLNRYKSIEKKEKNKEQKSLEIPVFYDKRVGLDLEALALEKGVSVEEIIKYHCEKTYQVYALGFLPGFAYMGSVDKRLASSRHENPRSVIPKGSVGIAENQTAIYPKESPGGWKILGRTPLELFSKEYKGFSYLHVGDSVRFKPITKEEFLRLGGEL